MNTNSYTPNLFTRHLAADPAEISRQLEEMFPPHIYGLSWVCTSSRVPYSAISMRGDHQVLTLKWVPGKRVTVRVAADDTARAVIRALSQRILKSPAHVATVDALTGDRIYEWHLNGEVRQWRDLPLTQWGSQLGYTGRA